MTGPLRLIGIALVLSIVQIGFLGSMIVGRANILRDGQIVTLAVRPVDPRDLLRGDYVVLAFDISTIERALLVEPAEGDLHGSDIHVRLSRGEDGNFRARAARLDDALAEPPGEGEVDLAGIVRSGGDGSETLQIVYGLERFYVPEGEGRAIETAMRQDLFQIVAAIAADGTGQIKTLLHDGTPVYREPLY